ncbi:energy transducer TonB [Fulvivirga sedimenti]|uniref:TonB C-terminal domain-containing protein n=1 Tax=Fulvivirga sedimenti TaxID=2879465 RepID=A0A9X1HWS5_9BACT|nr:hypothetical protein [Fulvivirga sedimenti]MCA6078820.1 hypothetical protein [Fulvivirga sedimenti]
MKLVVIILILITAKGYSQSIEQLEEIKKGLKQKIYVYQDSIKKIEDRIDRMLKEQLSQGFELNIDIYVSEAWIYEGPDNSSELLVTVKEDTVHVVRLYNKFFSEVIYKDMRGYGINFWLRKGSPLIGAAIEEYEKKDLEEIQGTGHALNIVGWIWDEVPRKKDSLNENGTVTFEFTIDEDGYVIAVRTLQRSVSPSVAKFYEEQLQRTTFSRTGSSAAKPGNTKGTVTFNVVKR